MAIYRLLKKDISFDQEAIDAMHSAYEQVCAELGLKKKKDDRVTEVVALKIIEAARAGQRDPATLRLHALFALGIMRDDQQK
jgi:hypothetical protein